MPEDVSRILRTGDTKIRKQTHYVAESESIVAFYPMSQTKAVV